MRRILLIVTLIIGTVVLNAQKSIDAIFNKYAERNGFVTFTISGNFLNLSDLLDDDSSCNSGKITGIRVLVQNDENSEGDNFYKSVIKEINLNNYEEFMRIKEKNKDVRMLVRAEGDRFKEFLLISGGKDNVLIQVKGTMTYAEAKKFSVKVKKDHGMDMFANH